MWRFTVFIFLFQFFIVSSATAAIKVNVPHEVIYNLSSGQHYYLSVKKADNKWKLVHVSEKKPPSRNKGEEILVLRESSKETVTVYPFYFPTEFIANFKNKTSNTFLCESGQKHLLSCRSDFTASAGFLTFDLQRNYNEAEVKKAVYEVGISNVVLEHTQKVKEQNEGIQKLIQQAEQLNKHTTIIAHDHSGFSRPAKIKFSYAWTPLGTNLLRLRVSHSPAQHLGGSIKINGFDEEIEYSIIDFSPDEVGTTAEINIEITGRSFPRFSPKCIAENKDVEFSLEHIRPSAALSVAKVMATNKSDNFITIKSISLYVGEYITTQTLKKPYILPPHSATKSYLEVSINDKDASNYLEQNWKGHDRVKLGVAGLYDISGNSSSVYNIQNFPVRDIAQ